MDGDSQIAADTLINWIESRRSIGNLDIPAPNTAQIKKAIHCAMTVPDHKKLQPWRFIVTKGTARHELGRALLAAAKAKAKREGVELDEKTLTNTQKLPLRAPVVITVVTQMQYHEKVPVFEQILSAGASVQNLILALQAQGFSSVWRTGILCNEADVKRYFNVSVEDYVVGFIYTGTAHCRLPQRKPIEIDNFIKFEDTES